MTATSGTYTFAPSLGHLVLAAYRRCGIHGAELTAAHMTDARFEANLLMVDWAADGINLWQVEEGALTLTQGTLSYAMPTNIVFILDCYIGTGTAPQTDRTIFPISRSDYMAIANKSNQGAPTSFWFDRLINPVLYIWPTADADDTYTLYYNFMRWSMDSNLGAGTQPDVPYYYLTSFVDGLAARLSVIYAPDRADRLEQRAQKSWLRALDVGTENVPVSLNVQMRSYFR
jgi:hypothetical protein